MKNLILAFFAISFGLMTFASAQEYIFFYGNGCSHCAKVEEFFDEFATIYIIKNRGHILNG